MITEKGIKEAFELCNNYNYLDKSVFYEIKSKILRTYGVFDGYDYKEIFEDCEICKERKYYQSFCIKCDGQRYTIKNKYFLRYKLFDSVFHLPCNYNSFNKSLVVSKLITKDKVKYQNRNQLYLGLIKLAIIFYPEKINEIKNTIPGKECIEKNREELKKLYLKYKKAA